MPQPRDGATGRERPGESFTPLVEEIFSRPAREYRAEPSEQAPRRNHPARPPATRIATLRVGALW